MVIKCLIFQDQDQEDFIRYERLNFQSGQVMSWIGLYKDDNDDWLWLEDDSVKGCCKSSFI